jgi:oligopeptide transport system ATP-binding protein
MQPTIDTPPTGESLLAVRGLRVEFEGRAAVDDVSFDIAAGEVLGLVGESGSGKSTLARALLRLVPASQGTVSWRGTDLLRCRGAALRERRRDLQIVFQDPLASLDPLMTVGEILAEPLHIFEPALGARERRMRVAEMLERVGLTPSAAGRYPHEFSGGQCQRIGIARALALRPKFIVADEAVSALDVSTQVQILQLLKNVQTELGLSCLFIAHNLAAVRYVSDRIAVMYAGKIVEVGTAEQICGAPSHPYTKALIAATPTPDPDIEAATRRSMLRGDAPNQVHPPSGCRFASRCPVAEPKCTREEPPLVASSRDRSVACWLA